MAEQTTEQSALLALADADALRGHLDRLNDAGIAYQAAGMAANGTPFLVTLTGPYAEGEDVFIVSPWDSEVSFQSPPVCDECGAHAPLGLTDLAYPVHVVISLAPTCRRPAGHDEEWGHGIGAGYHGPLCGQPIFRPGGEG